MISSELLTGVESLGSIQQMWVQFAGGIVGAENVKLLTILIIALIAVSIIGFIFKVVKSAVTAVLLAFVVFCMAGSFSLQTWSSYTPEVIEQVMEMEQVQNALQGAQGALQNIKK